MIHRLRVKFVAICLALVTLVLAVVFVSVYSSARRNIELSSMEVLQRVILQSSFGFRPNENGQELQMPYFTVQMVSENTAMVTGGTYYDLNNTPALEHILTLCIQDGSASGIIDSYNLRFLRQSNGRMERIAFVDITLERATLSDLVRSSLQIGAGALLILLFLSIWLARWATRPIEQSMRQQRQFLSDASHELKTPLTVILSNAELLENALLEDKPRRWADNIHSESRQMKHLVEEMLTLARADHLAPTLVHGEQPLSDLVTDCALGFEPVAFESAHDLATEVEPGLVVSGDGDKLRRLVAVFLDNAVKYATPGTPIQLSLRRVDKRVRLCVTNQGPPIPPQQLSRLFERFYRADASRGEQEGFGLGLSIAAAIVAEHKGSIRAESDAEGTRFLVTLPLKGKAK